MGVPGDPVVKNPPANAGDKGLIPGLGRSPREENGNPLQYSHLKIPCSLMGSCVCVCVCVCLEREREGQVHC